MSAVETLREAAKVLRERAGAATPGPWEAAQDHLTHSVGADVRSVPSGGYAAADCCGYQGASTNEDAAYIATMHPGVALALADWLDKAGADCWAYGDPDSPEFADDDDLLNPHLLSALRAAEAILGGER